MATTTTTTTTDIDTWTNPDEEKKDDVDDEEPDNAALVDGGENQNILESIESDDVDPEPPALWKKLWDSMNPSVCLSPATACTHVFLDDEIVEYNKIVPPMLRDMKHPGKPRTAALQRLYRFTDRERHKNRVPVVCSTRFHTLDALIPCFGTGVAPHDRRQALLVLNNLCIPAENKRNILLGPSRDELLAALLEILRQKLPECHLVVACLFNLSFYEETKGMLLNYVPAVALQHTDNDTPEEYSFSQPTQKKDSMLRVLEQIVRDFVPYYVKHRNSVIYTDPKRKKEPPTTVEASTLRWTMCLLRNLATEAEHATLLATTTRFPAAALEILNVTAKYTDLSQWSHDSLPEACLVFWVWLVQASEEACRYLQIRFGNDSDLPALKIFEPITIQPGIQGVRAKLVNNRLRTPVEDETSDERLETMASF